MWLIIALAIWGLACLAFVSYELGWGAFWATVILAVLAHFFLGFSVFTLAITSPVLFAKYAAGYLGIGLGWSSLKFWFKMRKARKQYVTDKREWLSKEDVKTDGVNSVALPRTEAQWIERVKYQGTASKYAPTVSQNKWNILRWLWWWPFSVVTFLFEDLIRELWELSWKAVRDIFSGIRRLALGEAARDLD